MADEFRLWTGTTLDDRIQEKYHVDRGVAHLIAQKYLNLALMGLAPGTTILKAYTGQERERLLDEAAEAVQLGLGSGG